MDPRDDEPSTCLTGLVDVGVVQVESEFRAEFPDRVVEPLRDGVGREVEAEDWRQGDAFDAGEGARTLSTYMVMRSPRSVDVEPGAPSMCWICGPTGTAIFRSRIVTAAAENLSTRLGPAAVSTVTTPPKTRSRSSRRLPFMFQDSAANRPALVSSGALRSLMSQVREAPVVGAGRDDGSVVRWPGVGDA
ncbi:hypothetical protein OG426_04745 [Streptomyces canus]|uniref:hypothetical protein n=1 Tax=Streptomyces canus TaxID=58343 RepID=UPI003867C8B1|nr:hypothetical protein OG426_04745 [Streptomyces canus]